MIEPPILYTPHSGNMSNIHNTIYNNENTNTVHYRYMCNKCSS